MKYEFYDQISANEDLSVFVFSSHGDKGEILKRIEFIPSGKPPRVDLAFGDINKDGKIDDLVVSNNGDRNKVLATVAYVIGIYLNRYPYRVIRFEGSTEQRNRLYRMAVGLNLEELSSAYEILAEHPDGIQPFRKNAPIDAILIKSNKNFLPYGTINY